MLFCVTVCVCLSIDRNAMLGIDITDIFHGVHIELECAMMLQNIVSFVFFSVSRRAFCGMMANCSEPPSKCFLMCKERAALI